MANFIFFNNHNCIIWSGVGQIDIYTEELYIYIAKGKSSGKHVENSGFNAMPVHFVKQISSEFYI